MQIACTKKLLDELNVQAAMPEETPGLYSWRANLVRINRRKTLVLMCEQNRYVVVMYGVKAEDFKVIDWRILNALRHTLLKQRVNPQVIEAFFSACGAIRYVKNEGQSYTAKLNQACRFASKAARILEDESAYCDNLGVYASNYLVGDESGRFFSPDEAMLEDLKTLGITPVRKYAALELTATLPLVRQNVVRKLIVPTDITFFQLHMIMQAAFAWENAHLFDFTVYDKGGRRGKPVAALVLHEESLPYRDRARLVDAVPISEYLPRYKNLRYTYDYGDEWVHEIKVTRVLNDYTGDSPICISGEGDAPPEEIGGVYGYENFLKIMSDSQHPEYEEMQMWEGEGPPYDLDRINRQLSSVLLR